VTTAVDGDDLRHMGRRSVTIAVATLGRATNSAARENRPDSDAAADEA
jgi:hypothetical protein